MDAAESAVLTVGKSASRQTEIWPAGEAGFDNDLYVAEQSRAILERVRLFDGKLYLEFGGKLLFDLHAARVLPGYDPHVKIRLLQKLKNDADIILCIHAGDIERKRIRGDFGITYDADALKLIDDLRDRGLDVTAVVITRFSGQSGAAAFEVKLRRRGIKTYLHRPIDGYPANPDLIVSDQGYGANPYIHTTRPLVVVTGPGPNSGKMATCLSQVYHEYRRGGKAGYAKFETFPIWNLPLRHPVNIAYEAATADIRDFNLIDPFHLEAYNQQAVNYNRDVETFPVLRTILERITGQKGMYKSPTDMGVNRAGFAIVNDDRVRQAAAQEIIRRYFRHAAEYAMGLADQETVERVELLMKELNLSPEDRPPVTPARQASAAAEQKHPDSKGDRNIFCGAAMTLPDGRIVTGVNSPLLHAASSLVLNAVKELAGIPHMLHLLSPKIIESIARLKQNILRRKSVSLDLEETLIALSIAATTNPTAELAVEQLKRLYGCEVHMTHMPTPGDETGLRRLGLNFTTDPNFAGTNLFAG
jgi:uncharacterized protein (UPF0371 family)